MGHSSLVVPGVQINLTQMLSKERRFDLILCIETWHKLEDSDRFLSQIRELLSQARREQDPNQVSGGVQC